MPGRDRGLQDARSEPSAATMKSERETSRRPRIRCASRATSPSRSSSSVGQVGPVEGDELGGVAGAEVELVALLVLDRHRHQRGQPVVALEHDDADVDAVVEPLDQRVLAVGVGADQGRGQRGEAVDAGDAEGAAAAGRLDHDPAAEAVHDVLHQRGGADVAEGLGGEPDAVGDRDAVAAQQLAGGALVVGDPAGVAARADVGHPDQLEQRLDLAVLAELAVQRGERRRRPCRARGCAAGCGRSRRSAPRRRARAARGPGCGRWPARRRARG